MIYKIFTSLNGNVRVIEKIKAHRGIGKEADEVIIFEFNRFKHPKTWQRILSAIGGVKSGY